MNNPIELAKFSVLVSEGIVKLINDENPQIEIPPEIMGFNQRQRIFLGLVAMHYVANYIKDEYEEHIRGKFTPLEILVDFVLKTIFNLTFKDDFDKFPETVDFLIFVQYLVNYLNTKKET
jgi:hypothetical protein